MILSWFKKNQLFTVIIIFSLLYLLFFYKIWFFEYLPWGSDAEIKHWPAREFLYTSIVEDHIFPFYTDKIYEGFNIAGDFELGYMNPVNILSILLFGPFLSYKVLHFLTFLIGSLGLYVFLKKREIKLTGILIATVIFLYNFFVINHQIHFNIILIVPLFPWTLVLVDKYFETKKNKYIFYLSFLFSYFVLWGHPQTILILGVGALVYSFFNINCLSEIKEIVKIWLLAIFVTLIITLPQLLPTYRLYKNSNRDKTDYKQGSFNTIMMSNLFLPLQYGGYENYEGLRIFETGYSYTEIYIYLGISASILFIYSFLFGKNKEEWFGFILIYISLIFISARYIPYGEKIPLLTMFRHWNRGVTLTYFGLAFGAAQLFKKGRIIFRLPNLRRFCSVFILFVPFVIQFYNFRSEKGYFYTQALKFLNISWEVHTVWFVISILTVATLFVKMTFPKFKLLGIVFLLVVIDNFYYVQNPLEYRIQKVSDPSSRVYVQGVTNKIVIDYFNKPSGLQYLNSNYKSPFGYSQLVSKDYLDKLEGYNFGKHLITSPPIESIDVKLVNLINLEYIILEDGTVLPATEFFSTEKIKNLK